MACGLLDKGIDLRCKTIYRKYVQKAVIINFDDIDSANTKYYGFPKVMFYLKDDKIGYAITATDQSEQIEGSFSFSRNKNVKLYKHSVSIPIVGVDEDSKVLLKQLDDGKYVVALKFNDGTINIYGLRYGLEITPYSYSAQNDQGGGIVQLESINDEYNPPLIYDTSLGSVNDFDNLFKPNGGPIIVSGDYNLDYNNDFLIQQ